MMIIELSAGKGVDAGCDRAARAVRCRTEMRSYGGSGTTQQLHRLLWGDGAVTPGSGPSAVLVGDAGCVQMPPVRVGSSPLGQLNNAGFNVPSAWSDRMLASN